MVFAFPSTKRISVLILNSQKRAGISATRARPSIKHAFQNPLYFIFDVLPENLPENKNR
jgi:hypothetical protein